MSVVNDSIDDCGEVSRNADQKDTAWQLRMTEMHFTAGADCHCCIPAPTKGSKISPVRAGTHAGAAV
jgi:hypothetical protein